MATEQQAQLITEITTQAPWTGTPPVWSSRSTQTWDQGIPWETSIPWEQKEVQSVWTSSIGETIKDQNIEETKETNNSQRITKSDEWIMTKSERDSIWEDLKKSFKDLWRIPYLLILPLIKLIQGQYEKIPEERRKGLARMSKDIKESGKGGIQKLKDRWSKKDQKKEESKETVQDSSTHQTSSPRETTPKTSAGSATPNEETNPSTSTTNNIPQTNPSTLPEQVNSITNPTPQESETNGWNIQPMQTTINVETESGQQIKVTTTIVEEKKTQA